MRWLAALLFLSSFALGTNAVVKFSQHTHGNYYEDYPMTEENVGKRTKRSAALIPSILRAVGIASQCDPGWTGQFCENPMCNGSIVTPYVDNYNNRLIDNLYLPSGCTGNYYIPVDGVSMALNIQVNAAGTPWINLTDSNGNLVQGSIGAYPNTGFASYPATLPPGAYSLSIDNGGIPTTDCIVSINIFSNLAVTSGFALNPQTDNRPFDESGIDGTPMYYITHPVNLTTPGQVRALTIRNERFTTPVYRSQLTSRYGCAFEWYAGQFSCSATQRYLAHVDGIDQFGYPWRRTVPFSCLLPLTTSAPATTPGPIASCMNNGTLLYAGTSQATCFCPELFTGPQCEKPACMNGGFLAPSEVECVCPDGFYGINCQSVNCDPNYGPYLSDAKTLVVVVRTVQSMNQYSDAIIGAVTSEMKNSDYANYVLVRYYDDTYLPKSYEGSQADAFVADIKRIANYTYTGNCSDTVFDAIYSVFTDLEVYEKSPILHFTDAIASDTTSWRLVTEANSRRNLPIYSFFFPQSGCNFDSLSEGYRAIQNAGMFSGGLTFLDANSPSTSQLSQQITMIMRATTKNMNLVYANDLDRCLPNVQRSFAIDSSADTVIIIATGPNLLFSLWDPDNEQKNYYPISNDGMNYIWEVASTKVGQYVFSIAAANQQDPCSIRVVAKSQYDFFFATTFATWWDAIDSVPVVGTPYHLVAQLNGLYNATRDPFRLFAELTITTNRNLANNQAGKPMYYSNGQYRDGCGYHLYFGVADFCEFDNQPFYATVFADDNNGFTIQRTQISFCSITNTTTNPPGTCQNGGVIDPSTNSTCICQVGFTGDFCQSIVCQSGGTPAGTFCICPAGTFGTFCELYTCPTPNVMPPGPAQFEGKAMVFVVAARPSMQAVWTQLAANAAEFTRDCQHHSAKWIKSWVLVTINGDTDDLIVNSQDPKDFITGIQTVAGNLSAYYSTGDDNCQVQIMSGLLLGTYFAEPNSNIYVFTDASGPDDVSVYSQLFDKVSEYQITVNLIQTAPSICTSDGSLPDYIQDLAWMTSGFYYISPAIDRMLAYITAQYKTGVIGAVAWDNCSTYPAISYVAVDSQTQALTLAAIGSNITNVEAFLPDGTAAIDKFYPVYLVKQSNLWLIQYMAACEFGKGWNVYGTSCLSFQLDTMNWYNASRHCHLDTGGYLADVNNDAKDKYINTQTGGLENWIGLFRNGNWWNWDVPDGTDAHPLDATYQYWCTDGAWPSNDTNQDCVYMTATGCWKNADCSLQKLYSCQKHRYGQGYYPQNPSANAIMPGRWQFKVSSSSGGCYAQIKAQSDIQIFQGFVTDPHDDFPHMFANSDSANNYLAIAPTGISAFQGDGIYQSMEGNINYALIGYNNTLLNALTVANRPFCGYSYISQAFSCPVPIPYTTFFTKYSGIDQHGYAFDRYLDSKCNRWVTQCFNNGFLYNGACVCQPGWAGDRCSTPICQNGGVANGDSCTCGGAYSGKFCELPHCEPPVPTSFATTGRTLAIMLETSYGMASTIWLMQKNLKAALDSIQTDPTTRAWFTEFILYPFDSTSDISAWYPSKVSSNSDEIVDYLKTFPVATCPGNGTCSSFCPRPYLKVLDDVLSMPQFANPDSLVLIITQSTPEDAAQSDHLTQMLQETRAQINYILPAIDSPCGEGWNTAGVNAMYRTLQYSDGNIFVMSPADVCQKFIAQYIPTLYKSAAVESQQYSPCMDNDLLFQVEHEMYEFTIDYYMPVTNPPFTLTLTDPAGDIISLPPSLIISDSNYLGIIQVNDTGATRAGTYKLSIKGGQKTNYCFINIKGRSSIELYPGFVSAEDGYNGAITDAAHYSPVSLERNTLVVHAAGLDDANGMLYYAQFIDISMGRGLIHTTTMKRRNAECSYEWFGNLPIDWQDVSLLVIIYGRDGRGANFHRNYYITAVSNRPAVPPPPITQDCRDRLQTSVQQDFIFMIDSSLKNDQMTFNQIKAFTASVMLPYKFSPNFTQTAALTVADQAYGGFSFLAATSWTLWNTYVNNLTYSGQPGQNTSSGFNYIIDNYTSSNQGYRNGANVLHSIIYITNTNPTDADPQQVPYSLRRSGQFGIAVIAFNTPVTDQLKAIAGSDKCIYGANSLMDLNNYGTNFVQQFSCYNIPICGM